MSSLSVSAISHASYAPRAREVDPSAHASSSTAAQERERSEVIQKLQARDTEVRAHEQAHAAAGGTYAGAPSFGYQRGPDGVNYAVSGEVPIDVSPVSGDPEATILKMQQVKRAALAPSNPSNADRSIAASADAQIAAARGELMAGEGKDATSGEAARSFVGELGGRNAYETARPPAAGSVVSLVS